MPASQDSKPTEDSNFTPSASRLDVTVVDNWLVFDCPDCGQTIKIDREDCMYEIECPSCKGSFEPLLSSDTTLPPLKTAPARKRGRRRSRPRVPGTPESQGSLTPSRPNDDFTSKPTSASLPSEGKVKLTIKQSRSGAEAESEEGPLPVRSALELERRRVEATKDSRLHEDTGNSELDAVIEVESGGKYKRIRVRTRKKRATEKERARRFYILTGVAACAIMGLSLFFASRMFLSEGTTENEGNESATIDQFTDADPIGPKIGNANVLISEFLKVDTVPQLLKVIRKPKRLENIIREYYSGDKVDRYNVSSVKPDSSSTDVLPEGFRRFRMTSGSNVMPIYAEKTSNHGYRLDWESLVGYGTMPWKTFIETKSTRISTMRAYVTAADYYEEPFGNEQRYAVVKLDDATRKHSVYGYFLKADLNLKNLYTKVLAAEAEDEKFELRMILKIRFPAGAENPAQVEIIDEVNDSWLRP